MTSQELAKRISALAQEKKGSQIVIINISKKSDFADFFVIISGSSNVQVKAICDHIEDERRLFYVAMTRASEQVCFLYPPDSRLQRRIKAGDSRCPQSTENGDYPASCFVYEANLDFSDQLGRRIEQPDLAAEPLQAAEISIGDRYLKAIKTKNTKIRLKRTRPSPESSPAPTGQQPPLTINELAEGLLVEHPLFGPGVVTSADRRKGVVIVHFDEHGSKNLVVKYAGLQPGRDPYPDGVPF